MAYGVKYRFPFESVEGIDWTIDILKNGYSGTVNVRPIGGSPQLRKDKNDNICGTSLDIVAECNVDGEFEEFSSSNPFAFQVKAYRGSTLVWQGYVSPELYNAPDIAPPYDVRVTATDGLGELKLHFFEAQGRKSISALLTYLLGFTGLSLGFRQITDLSCSASGVAGMLSSVYVDIDFLAGETCYDVLQYLLGAIHSTITQDGSYWLIQKETGMSISSSAVSCYVNGVSSQRAIEHFGSMTTHSSSCWPVGHMTREYVAPKKKMIVTADNHYRQNILGTWSSDGGATDEGDYWELPSAGDGISQTVTFQQEVSKHLVLSIKVRNVGEGEDVGNLGVFVQLDGSYYQAASHLYLSKYTGKRRRTGNDAVWSTVSSSWDAEVQAPAETDTDQDYVTIDLVIPLYNNGARSYVRASSLNIQIFNGDQLYSKRVYGVSLYQYEQTKGFKKVVNIDNGARGEAPDLEVIFPCTTDLNNYNGAEELLYAMPVNSSAQKISTWSTQAFSSLDYLSLIARDYAISIATPRVRVSGVLQTPASGLAIPVIFVDDHDSVKYIVESFSWDLYNDEVSVQMISVPSSSITIDGDETMEGETGNPLDHQQADSYSSGGGGGGITTETDPVFNASPAAGITQNDITNWNDKTSNTGTVTSVTLTASTGISITNSGTPITETGARSISISDAYRTRINESYTGVQNLTTRVGDLETAVSELELEAGVSRKAPRIVIYRGFNKSDQYAFAPYLLAEHPAIGTVTDAEFVLMMMSPRRARRTGNKLCKARKAWGAAMGSTGAGGVTFTSQVPLLTLRTFILQNYVSVFGRDTSSMTYATYQSLRLATGFGFPTGTEALYRKKVKRSRVFGIAVRWTNPEFQELASGPLSDHTTEIYENGKYIPRWIYSDVAPIRVSAEVGQLDNIAGTTHTGGVIGFQLLP